MRSRVAGPPGGSLHIGAARIAGDPGRGGARGSREQRGGKQDGVFLREEGFHCHSPLRLIETVRPHGGSRRNRKWLCWSCLHYAKLAAISPLGRGRFCSTRPRKRRVRASLRANIKKDKEGNWVCPHRLARISRRV